MSTNFCACGAAYTNMYCMYITFTISQNLILNFKNYFLVSAKFLVRTIKHYRDTFNLTLLPCNKYNHNMVATTQQNLENFEIMKGNSGKIYLIFFRCEGILQVQE